MKSIFLNDAAENPGEGQIGYVFSETCRERLGRLTELYPNVVGHDNFAEHAPHLSGVDVAFSTWGMPKLSAEHLAVMPNLRAVFYAAGSVKAFASPLLDAGITVVSAWAANAVPVAEFTLAQIVLSCKGYWNNVASYRQARRRGSGPKTTGPGIYGETVALIGFGMIGQKVAELLRPFRLRVLVVDPFVPDATLRNYGVERATIPDAFARAIVVSNHLPNLAPLRGALNTRHFSAMRPGATFINTGRGAQVDEDGLCGVLRERPDLTALLDVTEPEPPAPDSELWTLPNVRLSTHIAGSINDEVHRMADWMVDEFEAWRAGRPLRYAVTTQMLDTMA